MNEITFSVTGTSDRTVAYLDILGFKDILGKYPYSRIGEVYFTAITKAKEDIKIWVEIFGHTYKPCDVYSFSDSIVIFSPDNSKEGFLSVVLHVKNIMQNLIVLQLPVRGAIAFGEIFLRSDPLIFLGEGYMRALELESQQEWMGVSIDESVEENFTDFFEKDNLISTINVNALNLNTVNIYFQPSIVRYNVPMKCGHKELRYTVNWLDNLLYYGNDLTKQRLTDKEIIEAIKKALSPNSNNLKKYDATIEFIEYVNSIIQVGENGMQRHFVHRDKYT